VLSSVANCGQGLLLCIDSQQISVAHIANLHRVGHGMISNVGSMCEIDGACMSWKSSREPAFAPTRQVPFCSVATDHIPLVLPVPILSSSPPCVSPATLLSISAKTRICKSISLMFEFSLGEDCGSVGVVMEPQPDEQTSTYGLCLSAACYIRVQTRRWGK
jgi:hypothetical protein